MKTIYEFAKGDEIVRVIPAKPYPSVIDGVEPIRDRSYIGEKMIFVGIANGVIYLRVTDKHHVAMLGNRLRELPLDVWDDGWDNYFDPENLLNGIEHVQSESRSDLLKRLQLAIDSEDYESAEIIRRKLNEMDAK